MGLGDLIAKARAEVEAVEPVVLVVEFAGELVRVSFLPLLGFDWSTLTTTHPPRVGSTFDRNVGYNVDAVTAAYPRDKITANGEPVTRQEVGEDGQVVTVDEWADLVRHLSSPNLKNIATVLWGVNQMEPAKRLADVGKASAGEAPKK